MLPDQRQQQQPGGMDGELDVAGFDQAFRKCDEGCRLLVRAACRLCTRAFWPVRHPPIAQGWQATTPPPPVPPAARRNTVLEWPLPTRPAPFLPRDRMLYRRQVAADLSVQAAGAVLFGIAGTRLLLDGQLHGAALAFASAALATAATWAITYHSRAWCRHREALYAACCALHFSVAAHVASIGLNFIAHHGGSSFRMLVQLSYANTAIWQVRGAGGGRRAAARRLGLGGDQGCGGSSGCDAELAPRRVSPPPHPALLRSCPRHCCAAPSSGACCSCSCRWR